MKPDSRHILFEYYTTYFSSMYSDHVKIHVSKICYFYVKSNEL